ncbi:MAG TPA: polysaccharide biosynthesis/export family protein [Gemmataceae bacterium]|nr:polysaccharide biosynthesis/export family protein [Gemmataceae bacterium]
MPERRRVRLVATLWVVLAICTSSTGCHHQQLVNPADSPLPRELEKASLPPYVIEPPDLLTIDALRLIPLPPYHVEPLDALFLQVRNVDPENPLERGIYQIEPEGTLNLGIAYGRVRVVGLTVDEVKAAIEKHLRPDYPKVEVSVSLYQSRAFQFIRGEHLVRPDGTISLGTYGSVYVTGMTLDEAKKAVETQLGKFLLTPEVSLDVLAYNSKIYYVITDGGGNGEAVVFLPITGNETVLDALGKVGGLAAQASKKRIWIARPAPANANCGDQILPVDWNAIVQCGKTATNYQILPGDRIYIKAQPLITFTTMLDRLIAPVERAFGVTLLGQETIRSFERPKNNSNTGSPFGI